EPEGGGGGELAGAGVPLGQGQRLDQPQRLTGDAERFPARRQDPQPSALSEHSIGELRRRLDHVLAVVQYQQRLPLADRGDQPVRRIRARCRTEQCIPEAERGQRRLRHVPAHLPVPFTAPMAASSTSQTPSGRSPVSVRAVSVASLVFPEPPGRTRVVSRCSVMSSRTAATSSPRPTKLVSSARTLVFRLSSRRPSSPRSNATCKADSSGEGSTPSASASASLVRS